jgi:hypothetical protein
LGNGFGVACSNVFQYPSLYEAAVREGLSERAAAVFDYLGTNNFEGVMRLLEDAHWVARTYGLLGDANEMLRDVDVVKRALVGAVARSHLQHPGDPGEVAEERKDRALQFLSSYHNVFTTNYDLLAYWVAMRAVPPALGDGFRPDPDDADAEHLVFSERIGSGRGLFFLHGALHLYQVAGETRKHSWIRSGRRLTELIVEGLEHGQYPLFVAEGLWERKAEQIQRNAYLAYCLGKLSRIREPLVIFGHGMTENDTHITHAIADNEDLSTIYVGLHGDLESAANLRIVATTETMIQRRRVLIDRLGRGRVLEAFFFPSATARVWD